MFEFVRFLDKRTQLIVLYINVTLIVSPFLGNFMFKEERKRKILEIIESRGKVVVSDLSHEFNVSEMTIRRDLMELSQHTSIERTHGGAVVANHRSKDFEAPMADRISTYTEEKRKIAAQVAGMIGHGETIFLSSGSTTYWVAKTLLDRSDLTVVINSLILANILARCEDMVVIVVGGFLRRSELSLVGHFAQTTVKDIRVDKVIMGIRGIHPEYGLTSDNLQELMTDRAMMSMSDHVIVVADHTKFGLVAPSRTAPVTAAKTIITTHLAPKDMVASIRQQGVQVILV